MPLVGGGGAPLRLQLGPPRTRRAIRLAVANAGVPGLGRTLHVSVVDAGRAINTGELPGILLGLGPLGDGALARRPKLLELGVELLDPGADLLRGSGRLAAGDEIAGGPERLATVETQLVEQTVEPLPQGLAALIHLRFRAGGVLRPLAGRVPRDGVLRERFDLAGRFVDGLLGRRRLRQPPGPDQLA